MNAIDPNVVLRKTAKGQQEVDTRAFRLPMRVRALLIMVNGERSVSQLLAGALGTGDSALRELLAGGFVEARDGSAVAAVPAATPAARPDISAKGAAAAPLDLNATQRAAVKAIEDLLGPEGESIALKIERCKTPGDLKAVLERTRDLIAASRGELRAQKFWAAVLKS
jgi:hypothetical protein